MFIKLWNWWYPRTPLQELSRDSLKNLKILSNREELLSCLRQGGIGAELGVEYGHFSKNILRMVEPETLYLVDLWKDENILRQCKQVLSGAAQVEYCAEDSVQFLKRQSANSLDWVYIDTDHGYGVTYQELVESARVVKNEGLICGHDYVHISGASLRSYGVIAAVHEFCNTHGYEMVFLTHESHRHLSFALRKMP